MGDRWTDENTAHLKRRWAEGVSSGILCGELGVSRNSVIGKVHRLGLEKREATVRIYNPTAQRSRPERQARQPRKLRYTPKNEHQRELYRIQKNHKEQLRRDRMKAEAIAANPPKKPAMSMGIGLLELTDHTCKFPYGDGPEFTFCGHKNWNGGPYCEAHARLCYVPISRREQRTEQAGRGA